MAEDQAEAGSRGRRRRAGVRGARARLGRRAARRRRPRAHRRDAPQHGARHGRGRPRPVPGREAGHRARHRQRLLLRLRAAARPHARRPGGDRGPHGSERQGRSPVRAQGAAVRRGAGDRRWRGPGVQGRDPRRPPGEGRGRRRARSGHDVLRARPVPRPVPRPACRVDGEDRPVQAALGLRRLLARRPGARVDAADLRHGLGDPGGARPVPVAAGGGEEARPPPARRAARPVQLPRRRARVRVLAPEGLAPVPDAARRDARAPGAARLRGDLHAAARPPEAVGAVRPLGALSRQHVPRRRRGAVVQPQADELPRVLVHLPLAAALVPRPAAAPVRVRRAAPQRAVGRAVRPHARAALRHRRRAHLRAARTRSPRRSRR